MTGRAQRALVGALAVTLVAACGAASNGSIGVMARIDPPSGRIIIVDVPPGLAGARAGLEVGDEVLEIDHVPVPGMSREEFHQAVVGPVGSTVVLAVLRHGQRHEVRVSRMPYRQDASGPSRSGGPEP